MDTETLDWLGVRNWHGGKLVFLWGGVCAFWFVMKDDSGFWFGSDPFKSLVWEWLFLVGLAYALFCLVVTWAWLSGRESVRNWHGGKLVFLWGGVCAFWFVVKDDSGFWFGSDPSKSLGLFLAGLAYALFCLVVTWVWLSGREGK